MSGINLKAEAPYLRFLRERRAAHAAAVLGSESRAALALASMRAGLSAHRERTRAAVCLDEQRAAREAARAGRTALSGATTTALAALSPAGRKAKEALAAAQRRDDYRTALSFPMTGDELLAAAGEAVQSIGLADDDLRNETLASLLAYVIRRHGAAPLRCDVGREWMRARALALSAREDAARERATGARAAQATAARWAAEDSDSSADDSGPDAIWRIAAGMPAPRDSGPELSARQIGIRLQLTERQTAALALTLESSKRTTVALSGAERKAAADARAILKRRYPDALTLRLALHPAAIIPAAILRAQRILERRASAESHGSHLPGSCASASTAPLRTRPAAASAPEPRPVVGPLTWHYAGDGYSGRCALPTRPGWRGPDRPAQRPVVALTHPTPLAPRHPAGWRSYGAAEALTPQRLNRAAARTAGLAAMNAKAQRSNPLWQRGQYRTA